jgi:ubiquinone/menaquinone biosynthesis C-methylase UbiE
MINRRLNFGREVVRHFLDKSNPFKNVLDLGAGCGLDLNSAKAVNPQANLLAIELLESDINNLREKGIKVFPVDIEKKRLPFEDKSVDVIIANQILEHTKEIFWIMHEISRVLSVNGKLILGVPNLASLHNRLLLLFGKQPTPIQLYSSHIRGYTKSGFLNFLNIFEGLRVVGFKGSNFYPFPSFLAKPLAKILPSLAWGIFFHIEKTKEYSGEYLEFLDKNTFSTFFYAGQNK